MCVCVCIGVYILAITTFELQSSLNNYTKRKLYTLILFNFIFFSSSFFFFLLIQSNLYEKLYLYYKMCILLCVFRYQKKYFLKIPWYYLVFTRIVLVQV